MDRKDGTVIIKVHEALLFTGDILRIAKCVAENGVNSNVSGGSAKSNKQWRFDNGIGVCYIEKQKRKEPAGACVTG